MAKTAAEHLESQRTTQSPPGWWGWWGAVHTHALSFLPPSRASLSGSPPTVPHHQGKVWVGVRSPAGWSDEAEFPGAQPSRGCPVCTVSADSSVWTVPPGTLQAMALHLG